MRYKEEFPDIHIGYSGHELGYVPTLGAVALGARGMAVFKYNCCRWERVISP